MAASRLAFVGVALALVAPAVSAEWLLAGEREPSTTLDLLGAWMFLDADQRTGDRTPRVYFNALAVVGGAPAGALPLNAAGETRLAPPGSVSFVAFLGYWKDCNADGYVGAAESALLAYASASARADICPPGTRFNFDGMVQEFIWIGPKSSASFATQDGVIDPEAAVWGDFGAPGADPHVDCAYAPVPRGTLTSTGALIAYADCGTRHSIAATLTNADADGDLGLRFDDPGHPERDCDHLLNQRVPLFEGDACERRETAMLEENSEDPALAVWDCSRPDEVVVRDPTAEEGGGGLLGGFLILDLTEVETLNLTLGDEQGNAHMLPALAPAVDPDGSLYDAVNQTESGAVHRCAGKATATRLVVPHDDALLERDFDPTDPREGKRHVDFPFSYKPYGKRDWSPAFGKHAPKLFGVNAAHMALGEGWRAQRSYSAPEYRSGAVREDLQPSGHETFTFYARVGLGVRAVAELAASAAGAYGAEACGGATSDVHGGWDCEPGHWADAPVGATTARPGDAYWARDVDCLDGRVAEGAHVGLGSIADDGFCPR